MSRVVLLTTGGTISSRSSRAGGTGVVATDDAETIGRLAVRPGSDVQVEAHEVMRIGSYQMRLADLRAISDAVAEQLDRDDIDGIVITHGTDTLEETAALLDLVHDDPRPVVLTGAQRAADVPDTDGPRNLADAVDVAASPAARDSGVLVAFAGSVLPARGTLKVHTVDLAAFANAAGPLGEVVDGRVHLHHSPRRPKPLPRPEPDFDTTRVDLVPAYPGSDDVLLRAAVGAGATGVVLLGTGVGNGPPDLTPLVQRLTDDGVVVGLSSRVPNGPVLPVYGNGGGADLVAAGAVPLSRLPASQARIVLALLLSTGAGPTQVAALLADYA
jgi:L-asparaginase